jgi:uncharacterized protein YyaL (SSP411 family)
LLDRATMDRARAESRLLLLLASREACPRCRDLEAAAFDEPAVAALVDGRFAMVRFDPDERPDLAQAAADALVLLPQPRPAPDPGLPFVLAATPDGRPIDGASLRREGRPLGPALGPFLAGLAAAWTDGPAAVETRAGLVLASLREAQGAGPPGRELTPSLLTRARAGLADAFDRRHGGFGLAPRRVPHADLRLLLAESARTGDRAALAMATATLDGVLRGGLRDPRGGFFREAAAEDWSGPVLEKTLADNALLLRALALAHEETSQAAYREAGVSLAEWLGTLADARGGFVAGLHRASPTGDDVRDERVFAFANGLALSALARSGAAFDRPRDLERAKDAAARVVARLGGAPELHRVGRGDEASGPAFLDDYAFLAEGLLDLADATGERRHREAARALADQALARFSDPAGGGLFESAEDGLERLARRRDPHDTAFPSANGVMASVLARLARLTGETRYLDLARRIVLAFASDLARSPRGLSTLAASAGELLGTSLRGAAPPPLALPEASSRLVRGAVTLEATVTPARLTPGQSATARLRLTVAPGSVIVGSVPKGGAAARSGSNLYGLTVAVPGEGLRARSPRYPPAEPAAAESPAAPAAVYSGTVEVEVPVLAPAGLAPGPRPVRLRVVFQACDARRCAAPASELMEASVTIAAP